MHPPASRGKPGSASEVGHWGELMRHPLAALSCGLAMLCLAAGEGRAVLAQEKPPLAFEAPATAVSPSSAPTLPVTLEQQLGFRLRRDRHQIEILRIRSVERPRADEN